MKFVFQVTLKPGHSEQEYIDAWKKGSLPIQASVGAQGTILYRNLLEPEKLLAIATWESKDARDKAMQKLKDSDARTDFHKEFGDIVPLGYFEEIAKVDPIQG